MFFLFGCFGGSNSSSLLGWLKFLELRDRLLDVVDDGEDGIELECDDGGGVSNKGNDDKRGSFSISSGSSSSLKLMIFFASSSASIISNVEGCEGKNFKFS